ncbi:GNAT family N-acetyltransferase [Nitratifractor sp.]|uniref:GNAT family N-acetyltransferase n=1 Tax=Nitratifractor sp. TaxID=2268144 RepID=UPI0025F4090B|nr:GNAT family N-acetyltransferase [Nitratifractor sp.]
MSEWRLRVYDPTQSYRDQKKFDCDNVMINRYAQKNLKKRVKNHSVQGYVLSNDVSDFVGFYTLETFTITKEIFQLSPPPTATPPLVPAIKLGMLGVDKHYQKMGLGRKLLKNAIKKTAQVSKMAGCKGLFLWAEEEAVTFYSRLGFLPIQDITPTPMFLDIETILDAIVPRETQRVVDNFENGKRDFETPISFEEFKKEIEG